MRSLLLLLVLLLSGCTGSTGTLGVDDDDSVANDDDAADDDDASTDDDDASDDDDATPPKTLEEGFLIWDGESEYGGPNGGPAIGWGVLPRGSLNSCDAWFSNGFENTDDNYIGLYFSRGQAVEWEGDYIEYYADCRPEQPDSRCFSAWGPSDDGGFWETQPTDTFTITAWGDVIYGVLNIREEELGVAINNCGESDFDDYDGDSGAPEEAPTEESKPASGWGLRFR